ncbi:MAG: PQQ-binding-like beta-propeller repeat protein [Candidatus Obscuribacterales bacterium]|nr:PQQ-binding-like beta-propeller repeat protein [Candidatus Obscuribacterales bacterium]
MMFTPGDKLEFGHYTILRELGSGGMGVVYHCRDEFLQRELAIKMLLPELMADDDTVEVFRQEARLAAQLEHPGIVTIYNIGMENREGKIHHYMAMEYLPGGSLRQRIGKEPVTLEQAVEWMKELTTALHYAHKRGVMHQDIKPDNIFITQDNNAKLGDFGLALIATGVAFERAASGKGTPAYMSPELCRGEPRDHRSDIYSLGAVFFEMLTGQRPFKATGMIEMALKHATAPVPSAADLRKDLPPILNKAIKYMMAKTPDSRLQSLGDLLPSLDKLLLEMKVARMGVGLRSDKAAQAAQNAAPPPAPAKVDVDTAVTTEVSASVAQNAAATIPPPPQQQQPQQQPQPVAAAFAVPAEPIVEPTPQPAVVVEPEPVIVPEPVASPVAPPAVTEQPQSPPIAIDFRPEPAASETKREELDPSKERNLGLLWTFKTKGPIGWSSGVVLNRAKKSLYVGSADGALYSLDMQSGRMNWFLTTEGPIMASCLVSGENLVVGSADGHLYCVNAGTGSLLWKVNAGSPILASPAVSLEQAIICTKEGNVKAYSLADGTNTWTYRTDGELCTSPQVVEDTIFIAGSDKHVHALGADKGWRKWIAETDGPVISECLASTDSVYCATSTGHVYCFDIVSGNKAWTHDSGIYFLSRGSLEFSSVNYCGIDGSLVCLDKYKGAPLWSVGTAGEVVSGVVSITGSLYLACRNGYLQCFNARSGDLKWYAHLDAQLEGPPLSTSQAIYVGTVDGDLLALSSPTAKQ